MSRRTLIDIIQNVWQPSVSQAVELDLVGKEVKEVSALADATPDLDFSEFQNISLTTGSVNITALNAITTGMKEGEEVVLVITQGAAARTIAWGTGFLFAGGTGPTVTATAAKVDVFKGVVVGGDIVLAVHAQNIS